MRLVSPEEARASDARAIEGGTPGIVLMERAAAAFAREIAVLLARRPELGADVVVLAGPGNNGGDGFEVARLLGPRGLRCSRVTVLLLGDPVTLPSDAALTYRRLVASGESPVRVEGAADLEPLRRSTLVVDALLGTGLSRPVSPESLAGLTIRVASSGRAFVASVDVPSGIEAGSAAVRGPSVHADLTVTFGAPKIAFATLPAAGFCGRLAVAPIGVDVEEWAPESPDTTSAVAALDVARLLVRRSPDAHKGTFGTLLVTGGARGMAGAVALAARAALRAGAGKVVAETAEQSRDSVHALVAEATTVAWGDPVPAAAVVCGPGLGPGGSEVLRRCVAFRGPALFDADALNLAAPRPEIFAARSGATVLTPHPAEAGRLLGIATSDVTSARERSARELARRSGAVVVLKGFRSLVARPDGALAVVLAGNPGMATGGSGDVLSGVIGALLARGLPAWDAARIGAFLHGLAGDLALEGLGGEGLVAGDIVDHLPRALEHSLRVRRP